MIVNPENESGFQCPSGCIAPEACVNIANIRALNQTRAEFSSTLDNPHHLEAIRAHAGNLGSITVRAATLEKQHSALYSSCGLYRNVADSLTTTPVELDEMPELDN